MNNLFDNRIIAGLCGTAVSATGASLSVGEIQSIVSIIITVLGFLISVFIPLCVKLVKKIIEAKKDNVITKEEIIDIVDTGKEIVDKTESLIKEVSENKSEGDKE